MSVEGHLYFVWAQILCGKKSQMSKNRWLSEHRRSCPACLTKKMQTETRNPCKATLPKSSSGTASRSAWVAKSSSLEACYMTSQAWLFQKPWHFSWKKQTSWTAIKVCIENSYLIPLEFLWNSSASRDPPSLQSQSSGIRKTIAIHPLPQILFINPGIAISS